jgi:hypothetical protein
VKAGCVVRCRTRSSASAGCFVGVSGTGVGDPFSEGLATEGRERARDARVEHIIRNLDGTIGERNTYGHDPRNTPG